MTDRIRVAVSGINATDNPGPGVALAKSLKRVNSEIMLTGLSYDVHEPGNYLLDLFENSYLMPHPTIGWEPYKNALAQVKKLSKIDIFIPCFDSELPLLIQHADEIQSMGIKMFIPNKAQFELRSKDKLSDFCKVIDCSYPKTKVVHNLEDLKNVISNQMTLPCYIKGKFYNAYLVYNLDSAIIRSCEIVGTWGYPLLVQERVSGHEINLIGLGDGRGGLLGSVSIKKQLTTNLGKIWTGVTIQDEKIKELALCFCEVTQWRGPFELECMKNRLNLSLIEINPRFPSWLHFATEVGINLPQRLIDFILKGDCERSMDYGVGKFLVRQTSEFVTSMEYFQNILVTGNREGR